MVMTIVAWLGQILQIPQHLQRCPSHLCFGYGFNDVPASMLMARVGRRNGFIWRFLGVLGGIIASIGIFIAHSCFWLWVRYVSGPINPLLSFIVLLPVKSQMMRSAHALFLG